MPPLIFNLADVDRLLIDEVFVEGIMSYNSCSHLDSVPSDTLNSYNIVLAYYVTCMSKKMFKRKATDAYCRVCESAKGKLHACLECAFFGCLASENGKISHIKGHALKYQHYFAININHGSLFCFKCDDYIYNETFDNSLAEFNLEARRLNGTRSYMPWKPNAEEIALFKNRIKKISDESYFGLRGIVNVGSSCYINCIVQVLMHTPVLVNLFLSDKHICTLQADSCLMCELQRVFKEFYSGISSPFDPSVRFFFTLQKFCREPLGMEQQDSYELLQEILVGLHASCPEKDATDCNCAIQQIFYGTTQDFKKCQFCEDSSLLPTDYFMDILLDLNKKDDCIANILNRKYLEPYLLSDFRCSTCNKTGTTHLHQSIKKLPTVICFRMNCFIGKEAYPRSKSRRMQKKSTAFTFGEFINMSPYLKSKVDTKPSDGNDTPISDAIENNYWLFAVIFHKGTLGGGHYVAYVRKQGNRWYECDDSYIYQKSLEKVLQCEPFLLFYQKYL